MQRSRTTHAIIASSVELAVAIIRVVAINFYANPIAHGEFFEEVEVSVLIVAAIASVLLAFAICQRLPSLLIANFASVMIQAGNNVFLAVWAVRLIIDGPRRTMVEETIFVSVLIVVLVHILFEVDFAIAYFRLRKQLQRENEKLDKEDRTFSALLSCKPRENLQTLRKYFHFDIAKSNVAFIVAMIELFKTVINGLGAYTLLYQLFKDRNALIFEIVLQGVGVGTIALIFVSLRTRRPAFRIPNIVFQFFEVAGYIYVFVKGVIKLTAVVEVEKAFNTTKPTFEVLNSTSQTYNVTEDKTSLYSVATVAALVGLAMQVLLIVYSIIDYRREMVELLKEEAEKRAKEEEHQAAAANGESIDIAKVDYRNTSVEFNSTAPSVVRFRSISFAPDRTPSPVKSTHTR